MILFTILAILLLAFAVVCGISFIINGAWIAAVLFEPIVCVALIILVIKLFRRKK